MSQPMFSISLPSETETAQLGRSLARVAERGDCILLHGQIGAGKSSLTRAFIRARLGQETEVPSPTFTLIQTYEDGDAEIWHADLYRLSDTQEAVELGLIDAFSEAIVLIEWPEILEGLTPSGALNLTLHVEGSGRRVDVSASSDWIQRLKKVGYDT